MRSIISLYCPLAFICALKSGGGETTRLSKMTQPIRVDGQLAVKCFECQISGKLAVNINKYFEKLAVKGYWSLELNFLDKKSAKKRFDDNSQISG